MTHKTIKTVFAAAALLAGAATLKASVDMQARFGAGADFDIGGGLKLAVATEQRLNNDLDTYYYGEYDIGLNMQVLDWLSVAPTLRMAETRKNSSSSWVHEYRPMFNATLSYTFEGWKFEDRNRFEWRNYETSGSDSIVRYRNRVKISTPWKWTDYKVNPYASAELFNDLNGKNSSLVNFEVAVGFSAAIPKTRASFDVYYMAELKETADTSHKHTANIAGAAVKFKF